MQVLEKLTEKAQAKIMDAFYESAQVNATSTNGLLVAYKPNLERFPYQSLSLRTEHMIVNGAPRSPKETYEIAAVVDQRCKGLSKSFYEADCAENHFPYTQAGKILLSKQNVVFGTDHEELVDIAFDAAGTSAYLREQGVEHQSALLASKAIDFLGVDTRSFGLPDEIIDAYLEGIGLKMQPDRTVPVRDFLGLAVDLILLSIPNSQSFVDLRGMQADAVEAHNDRLKTKIASRMSRDGSKQKLPLAVYSAMPGTKNKELDTEMYQKGVGVDGYYHSYPEEIVIHDDRRPEIIGRISYGVMDFMSEAIALASAIRLRHGEQPKVYCKTDLHVLNSESAIDDYARSLTDLIRLIDGDNIYYDRKGNLPIIKQ